LRSLATIDIVFSLTLLILGLGIENVWIPKSNQQIFFVPAECQIQEGGTGERMIVFIIVALVRNFEDVAGRDYQVLGVWLKEIEPIAM
jgi:hypothetical protein